VTVRGTLCEGAMVAGTANPLTETPTPAATTCVTVRLVLPVLESCTVCFAVLPTLRLPNATLVGFSNMVYVAFTPVPLSATLDDEVCASLAMVTDPLAAPADAGANVACRAADCPAGKVKGTATPLTLKPAPLTFSWEMFTSLLPEFFKVTACVLLPFTRTLPYLRLVVLKESCEAVLPELPLSFTLVEPPPRDVIALSVPEIVPVVELLKETLNCVDCPGPRVRGVAMPEVENSDDDKLSCVMLTDLVPVLVSTAACVTDVPTLTLGNVNDAGVICTSSCGVRFAFEVLANPAQPPRNPVPARTTPSSAPRPPLRVRKTSPANFFEIPFTASPRAIFLPSTSVLLSEGRLEFRHASKILVKGSN
jgi:hypothetical protein